MGKNSKKTTKNIKYVQIYTNMNLVLVTVNSYSSFLFTVDPTKSLIYVRKALY